MIQAAGKTFPSMVRRDANLLKDGDNVLHYTAVVKKSSDGNAQITEGAFFCSRNL
ncbi:type 1 fimbrial protein [Escherichia coli]|nr:type 1 fimbrial protein [Escherichia coli]